MSRPDDGPARLFVALDVPEQAGLARVVSTRPVDGLRWVDAERLHCTLVFAGRVDDDQVDAAVDAAVHVAGRHPPLQVRLTGRTGHFGAGVLWAELEAGAALVTLAADLEAAWRAARLEVDARVFRPHVTLARRGRARVDAAACAAVRSPPAGWTADRLRVVESRPAAQGPARWRTLAEPRLAGSGADA